MFNIDNSLLRRFLLTSHQFNFCDYYSSNKKIKHRTIKLPKKIYTLEEYRALIIQYYENKDSGLLMLLNHCKKTISMLVDKSSNALLNFYIKKLDYLEEELGESILSNTINYHMEEQFQKRVLGMRSELKYIYDSIFNIENMEESKIYFNGDTSHPPSINNILKKINEIDGKKLSTKDISVVDNYLDNNENNFFHILFSKSSDIGILNVFMSDLNDNTYALLYQANKQGKLPFDNLLADKRFLVLKEINEKTNIPSLEEIKTAIFVSELKSLTLSNSMDEFEFLYQNILMKLNEINLYNKFNPFIFLATVLCNESLDIEKTVLLEDLIIILASYRNYSLLEEDILSIKDKYPDTKLFERIIPNKVITT